MDYPLILTRTVTVAAVLFAVGCVIHVLQSRKRASNTVLWILVISYLPFVGPTLYLVFGINRVKRRIEQRLERQRRLSVGSGLLEAPPGTPTGEASQPAFTNGCPEVFREFFTMMDSLVDASAVGGNRCELMRGGERVYAAMAEAVTAAQTSIHLTTFILDHDQVGLALLDRMAERAAEGVEVRVLVDGYGTKLLPMSRVLSYRKRGVDLRVLHQLKPLSGRFAINLRNHRKILVCDGKVAFTGGMNISARNLLEERYKHTTVDYHTRVQGPAVPQLQRVFAEDWFDVTEESLFDGRHFPHLDAVGDDVVRTINSGPDQHRQVLLKVFCAAIQTAGHSIRIVTPYFVPDPAVLMLLKLAALGGVDTRIILPRANNIRLIKYASRYRYRELMRAGVRIYERRAPFSHAKLFVIDDTWASVGSANWDMRTFHLQFDTNIGVASPAFVEAVADAVDEEMACSGEILPDEFLPRPPVSGALERAASMFEDLL